MQILDRSRVDPRYANSIERRVRHRSNRWRNQHASREQRGCKNPPAKVSCQLSDGCLACISCCSPHGRFPGYSNPNSVSNSFLQFLPLAGWLGTRCRRRSNVWLKGSSAAVLAFLLVDRCGHQNLDRFAVTKAKVSPPFLLRAPGHPQGYWLAETLSSVKTEKIHSPSETLPQGIPCFATL